MQGLSGMTRDVRLLVTSGGIGSGGVRNGNVGQERRELQSLHAVMIRTQGDFFHSHSCPLTLSARLRIENSIPNMALCTI
jgi:hypothetical protein